jgi:hypothetical protein
MVLESNANNSGGYHLWSFKLIKEYMYVIIMGQPQKLLPTAHSIALVLASNGHEARQSNDCARYGPVMVLKSAYNGYGVRG